VEFILILNMATARGYYNWDSSDESDDGDDVEINVAPTVAVRTRPRVVLTPHPVNGRRALHNNNAHPAVNDPQSSDSSSSSIEILEPNNVQQNAGESFLDTMINAFPMIGRGVVKAVIAANAADDDKVVQILLQMSDPDYTEVRSPSKKRRVDLVQPDDEQVRDNQYVFI
jgi:hypothetical protein